MAVASKDRVVDEEEVVRAFDEERREAKKAKATVAVAEVSGARVEEAKATEKPATEAVEEKPKEAQAMEKPITATAAKTVEERPKEAKAEDAWLNDLAERASRIFGLEKWNKLLHGYVGVLATNEYGYTWLSGLPRDDDMDALALVLSASRGLRVLEIDQATVFARYLLSKMHIVYNPFLDTLQCYNPESGLYEPLGPSDDCKNKIIAMIDRIIGSIGHVLYIPRKKKGKPTAHLFDMMNLQTPNFHNKVLTELKARGLNQFNNLKERSKYLIALPNRVYLDLGEDFVNGGKAKVIEASPDYYVDVRINTPIDVALLNELAPKVPVIEPGANNWEEYKKVYVGFMIEAFQKHAPTLYGEFKKWVGDDEYVVLLLELIGFVMYPEYPIRAIFILLGGGNDPAKSGGNGKSTFLELLTHMVGKRNVVHIEFQDLAENRFMASQLYGKLANIVGDMSSRAIQNTSLLKALSGGDEVTADVKYKNPITFVNRAKLIASMNELPVFNDQSKAIKDRLHIIPFPNVFPENPRYRKWLINHNELPQLGALALVALRAVLHRGRFVTKGEVEVFSTTTDPVGEFIKQLITTGFDGCKAVLNKDAKTFREELYALFERWREENNVTRVVPKKVFTEQLSRWGIAVIRDKAKNYYYKGIQLNCENTETIEQYSEEGENDEYNEE